MNNILIIYYTDNIRFFLTSGTNWITWCQYLGSVAAFPLTLVAKEQYKRLQIDSGSIKHTLPEVKEEDENKPLLSL